MRTISTVPHRRISWTCSLVGQMEAQWRDQQLFNIGISFTTMEMGRIAMAGCSWVPFGQCSQCCWRTPIELLKNSWSALTAEALAFEIALFLLDSNLEPRGKKTFFGSNLRLLNNFTLHVACRSAQVASYFHGESIQSYLEDNGASASRNWSIPEPRQDICGLDSLWNVSRPVPDLIQRAYIAAWWNCGFTAQALNISANLHLSAGDQKSFSTYTSFISPFSITISNMDGSFFNEA
jgi:hypothetical protein